MQCDGHYSTVAASRSEGRSALEGGRGALEGGRSGLEDGRSVLEEGQSALEDGRSVLEEGQSALEGGRSVLKEGQSALEEGQSALEGGREREPVVEEEPMGKIVSLPNNAHCSKYLFTTVQTLLKDTPEMRTLCCAPKYTF